MNFKKEYLLPTAVILIILVVSLTLLKTSITGIFTLREENAEKEERLAVLQKKSQELLTLRSEELSAKVEKVEKIFPSRQPVLSFIASVSNLCEEEEISFRGVKIEKGLRDKLEQEGPEKEEKFPLTLMVAGELDKVFSFVKNLEKIPPVTKIESFAIAFVEGEVGEEGEVEKTVSGAKEIELAVTVFYQEPPVSIGKIDAPLPKFTKESEAIFSRLEEFKLFPEIQPTAQTGKEDPFR